MLSSRTVFLSKWLTILLALSLLLGCSMQSSPILYPKGPVAETERDLLFLATGIMLFTLLPVYLITFWSCWRYRAKGKGAYRPNWHQSIFVELFIWTGPLVIVVVIGILVVVYTYRLDPYKSLADSEQAFRVQAVAQNWKWLFIYPDQQVAVVNELAFPCDRPLSIEITSDTVMTSFMIPALGGQIYAMAGMTTRLNLKAYGPGLYTGRNTQFSGRGFPHMVFDVQSLSEADFDQWLERVKTSNNRLDDVHYQNLLKLENKHPVEYFSWVEPDLFGRIIGKYTGAKGALPLQKPRNLE
ncbi:COX aromatic rich motif-containing protein [Endozoicomonas numazuensis]|uniref:COX aromatic rich motif-containing protein n=1 Tax=Endozoicomonas numazuensis TaxID=1137799 RepID=UPI000ADD0DE2|nr:COX aromatic rich motif-containing protein [Endozoicomonas numazuensis]